MKHGFCKIHKPAPQVTKDSSELRVGSADLVPGLGQSQSIVGCYGFETILRTVTYHTFFNQNKDMIRSSLSKGPWAFRG